MVEKFFWADQIAEEIIKNKGDKDEYSCASGITPSGTIHIGNFREVITTELVVRALRDKGKKVRFVYSWDDFDRFRKVPSNVSSEFEKYIGMPVSDVPNPFEEEGVKSYAEHFEKEFENSLKKVGIEPTFIRQNLMNKKCEYAELIKKALDNKEEIRKILDMYRQEPLAEDWYPLAVYCEKCNKDFTKISNIEGYEVEYSCGCGFKNKIDYRKKGIVKLSWRVDWPMRWFYEDIDFEPGGADHSAPGSSFDTGKQIVKKVYGREAPLYQFYEWIKIKGGTEFSSSSGNALKLDDVEEIYEPEVLRYLFVGTRPNKGFAISFDQDVIKNYEDFDSLERKYFEGECDPQEKRIYELSILEKRDSPQNKHSFRHLVTLVQIGKTDDLSEKDKLRAEKAKNWIEKYAGEEFKFELQEEIHPDVSLGDNQKKALIELGERLSLNEFDEESLFNEFYDICTKYELKNTEFFNAAYNVLINKSKGPRLANFILLLGQEKVSKILEKLK